MRLKDKVAVITGAGSGMGLAMARRFAAEGAKLVLGDWNADRLNAAVEEIRASGGEATGAQGDISSRESAEALIDLAVSTHGRIDILVNNAGVMDYMAGVAELTDDIWRKVFAINLDGPMYTMRRAIPKMVEQGNGAIVNIASVGGLHGAAAGAAYTAAKHALVGLTKNTAWIYAQKGVRTNAIAPGGTKTNIGESMPQDRINVEGAARLGAYQALIPAMLEPEDIAALALFLVSDEAAKINGAIVTADGGWTAA